MSGIIHAGKHEERCNNQNKRILKQPLKYRPIDIRSLRRPTKTNGEAGVDSFQKVGKAEDEEEL